MTVGWTLFDRRHLDRHGRRQFSYNTLLAYRTLDRAGYETGRSVVMACADDLAAQQATADVVSCMTDRDFLTFQSLEALVQSVQGHDDWRQTFTTRYLDLSGSQTEPTGH